MTTVLIFAVIAAIPLGIIAMLTILGWQSEKTRRYEDQIEYRKWLYREGHRKSKDY